MVGAERRSMRLRRVAPEERKQLLGSIEGQIAHLQAVEAARQAALQRQVEQQLGGAQAVGPAAGFAGAHGIPICRLHARRGCRAVAATCGGAVSIAMQYLGTPYVWGGASPGGFDCSGLVVFVYSQLGISLPHYTGALWNVGTPVSIDQLQAGDLVFFYGLGHVGIYIGGGEFIHAPHTGDVVKISSLNTAGTPRRTTARAGSFNR